MSILYHNTTCIALINTYNTFGNMFLATQTSQYIFKFPRSSKCLQNFKIKGKLQIFLKLTASNILHAELNICSAGYI